jgi:lysophospholipase L1-like esterase
MKKLDLKDTKHFNLFGSTVLSDEGYNRFSVEERNLIKAVNANVAYLSTNSAGIMAKFETNSNEIVVSVDLQAKHNMGHMPATGQCGVDLYVYNEKLKDYVLHSTSMFDMNSNKYTVSLGHFKNNELRKYILNLPLYMGATNISIEVDDDATVNPISFSNQGRIVLYGTSIAQGGCVSRPGLLYSNILSRWLDCEFLNYGFSGSAFAEEEVASIIASRDNQKLLIIDIEANAGIDERLEKNLEKFIEVYKLVHPKTPIILVSRNLFAMDLYDEARIKLRIYYKKFLKDLVNKYQSIGEEVYFLDGSKFFKGNFTEYTVDGVHPNDLGSMEIAKSYYKEIKKILKDLI